MDDNKYIVKTWKEICKLTPFSDQTLQRKYGPQMIREGVVLKDRIGKARTMTVWAYPEVVKRYFTLRGQKKYI